MIRLHHVLLLSMILSSLILLVSSSSQHHTRFNPHNKKHAISRSSYHTEQGRHVDTSHVHYEGQGGSHTKYAHLSADIDIGLGNHLFHDEIYTQMSTLASTNLGVHSKLPSQISAASGVPEQIKLSVTSRPYEMVVNWLTWNVTETQIQFGTQGNQYSNIIDGQSITFVDPNSFHLIRYIHNVLLTNLEPGTQYYYIVGDPSSGIWSSELRFTTPAAGNEVQTIAVYGDMGLVNSQSMQLLSSDVSAGNIALVLHLGDYGYNMDELQGMTGDVFLNEMQNITSAVPFQGCPGNHVSKLDS